MNHWVDAALGYGPRSVVEEQVKKALDKFVEKFAIFVLKAKGKM
jgi:hypothetical protein